MTGFLATLKKDSLEEFYTLIKSEIEIRLQINKTMLPNV